MTEAKAVANTERPGTTGSIVAQLRDVGLEAGMTVMAHASLSRLGFVIGGAQTVVAALLEAVGQTGTLMMPTHSSSISEPSKWQNPPVPKEWWPTVRNEMPVFDPAVTPTSFMGAIVECFRHVPGVIRSHHPSVSAAAIGPNAQALTDGHELNNGLGEGSPQARLYDLDGHVLLLGVDHGNNTSLHISEYRADLGVGQIQDGAPLIVDGERQWIELSHLATNEEDFAELGEAFASTGKERRGPVGTGTARFMRSRDVVDFGVDWMQANRARADAS